MSVLPWLLLCNKPFSAHLVARFIAGSYYHLHLDAGNHGLQSSVFDGSLPKLEATELSDHTPQQLCSASDPETSRPIVAHHAHFPCYMYNLGE